MIRCQCPNCRNTFQAADPIKDGLQACPECRFQVRVPALNQPAAANALPGMITCECQQCRMKFQVPKEQTGTMRPCPDCSAPVLVTAIGEDSQGSWLRGTVGIIVLILIVVLFCLSRISILGRNSSALFQTVSQSISTTT